MVYVFICCMEDVLPQAICSWQSQQNNICNAKSAYKGLVLIKHATRHDNSIKYRDALSKCQICLPLDWLWSLLLHACAPVLGHFFWRFHTLTHVLQVIWLRGLNPRRGEEICWGLLADLVLLLCHAVQKRPLLWSTSCISDTHNLAINWTTQIFPLLQQCATY